MDCHMLPNCGRLAVLKAIGNDRHRLIDSDVRLGNALGRLILIDRDAEVGSAHRSWALKISLDRPRRRQRHQAAPTWLTTNSSQRQLNSVWSSMGSSME